MAVYEQSALGTALSSLPGAITDAMASNQQRQMNQQVMAQNMQAMQQSQMQLEMQKKQMGMDRGGYGNQMLSEYFTGLMMAPGTLATNADGNFEWSLAPEQAMPTQAEAWARYQTIVGPANITEADSTYFMTQLWPELVKSRAGKVISEINKLEQAGYDPSDMQTILYNNPTLKSDMSVLMPYIAEISPEMNAKFAGYMPQKPVEFMERMADLAPGIGTTAMVGGAGYNWMQKTPQKYIDEATKKFEGKLTRRGLDPVTRTTDKLTKAQTKLDEATKRNPRTPKGWNNRADDMDAARKTIGKEKDKIKTILDKARDIRTKDVAKNTRWRRAMERLPKNKVLNMPVAAFAPTVLGAGGQMIAGDKGEALGRGLGGGVQTAYGAAKGMSLAKWLMKRVPSIVSKKAAGAGTMALADAALPVGDILGAAWGLGTGGYEIYNAIQEWRKANQSY
tara:strand:- start:496 stop:1845 length:1350 start_codon:yes stop_codon:yes gene_type:complete